jgi:hypothetical protein
MELYQNVDHGKKYAEEIRKKNKPPQTKSSMPTKISTVQSILLIGLIIFLICSCAIYDKNQPEKEFIILGLLLLGAGQVLNIIALHNQPTQKSLLGLYLERKRLEEQKKIENLTAKK